MHGFPRFATWLLLVAGLSFLPALAAAEATGTHAAQGHAAAAEGHGGAHADPHLKLNWVGFGDRHTPAIIALIINSALLFWLLVHFGKAPVKGFLVERRKKVEEEVDQAFEEKVRAEGKLRGVVLRTKNLDEELAQLKEDLLRVGHDERDRLIADAGARAEKIRKDADAAAREIERAAARELRAQMVEQAMDAAGKSLRERLGPADQTRLADDFVRRLPAQGVQAR
ncbi:MAG: ATP synthase F0 subunit B [Deltaproteobacteria bacterium]|nr:ATP synthase F0 subunit B [Deltaproteobacteria bacterium]